MEGGKKTDIEKLILSMYERENHEDPVCSRVLDFEFYYLFFYYFIILFFSLSFLNYYSYF